MRSEAKATGEEDGEDVDLFFPSVRRPEGACAGKPLHSKEGEQEVVLIRGLRALKCPSGPCCRAPPLP